MGTNQEICAIAVMAKAPRPGQVKTRLVPPLAPEEAAALNAAFLRDITETIKAAARHRAIAGYIAFAPSGQEALFDGMLAPGTNLVLADGSGPMPDTVQGFGRSLFHAAHALFAQGHGSVCLLNSDSPTLPAAFLVEAAELLAAPGDRVVLGPAEDGGYYLIGMKEAHAALFTGISWSTAAVVTETRARARTLGLEVAELPLWYDVDDVGALRRLARDLTEVPPSTRACLERLRLFNPLVSCGST
ncbi:MAG TPA: TIGR04282 family arsenosugar biosynthesis glycosyltransferase [Stellaceae bacterium]|nr:TIGR04282 family arsenosugar biosynthesis glycosyltransferase [Stellaceae bacterium]